MKILTEIALVVTGFAMCCSAHSATNDIDQSKESVRVVVVSASKANIIPALAKTNAQAVAGLKVVYLVEALGNKPLQNWDMGHMHFTVDGKPVEQSKKSDDNTLIVVSKYTEYDWKKLKKPAVSDARRVAIYDASMPYFQLPKGKTDLHIETGFNLSTASFVFKDITVE